MAYVTILEWLPIYQIDCARYTYNNFIVTYIHLFQHNEFVTFSHRKSADCLLYLGRWINLLTFLLHKQVKNRVL